MPRGEHLLSLSVSTVINRIANATLVYQDGAASAGDFALSNADTFAPGAAIEIRAGASDEQAVVFRGVVTRQALKVREGSAPQLIVQCRHEAMKLSVGRKAAYFFDSTDSDVIAELFQRAGVTADVAASEVSHEQLVQFDATDWDFCLMRAQANGMAILTRAGSILVRKPGFDGRPAFNLQFGATVLETDLQLEARGQFGTVRSVNWDKANQEVLETDADDPAIDSPGNIPPSDLAEVVGLDEFVTRHPELSAGEAQSWADARWLRAQMNRITGRVKCEGIGAVQVADMVTLGGMGDRFNGDAFVTGVRHEFDLIQGWKTHLQFGGVEALGSEGDDVTAPRAAGLLPGINGLQVGIVVSNEDPQGEFRVRVRMPLADAADQGTWARVACLDAGRERGFFIRPEIGDEVVLGFMNDDPRQAVVLGMLNSSALPAPLEGNDENHEKVFQTRSGMRLHFDDEKSVMTLETPAGNLIALDEDGQAVTIRDQNDNSIILSADGIVLSSRNAVTIDADADIRLNAGGSLHGSGGTDLKMEGATGAEMSSSAIAKVRGSLVQIN